MACESPGEAGIKAGKERGRERVPGVICSFSKELRYLHSDNLRVPKERSRRCLVFQKKPDKGLKDVEPPRNVTGNNPTLLFFSSPFFFFPPQKKRSFNTEFLEIIYGGKFFRPRRRRWSFEGGEEENKCFSLSQNLVGFCFFFWLPLICHSGGFLPISRSRRIFLSCWEPWRGRCSFLLKSPSR